MARKRKAPEVPATPAQADYETRNYPPEKVASVVAGQPEPQAPPAPLPPAPLPPPPDFGHFTDPGLVGGPTILPAQDPGPRRTMGSSFLLTPFAPEPQASEPKAAEPKASPTPMDSAEVARLPQKPLPAYLLKSDEVEAHPPTARRLQMFWLAASLALIGGSLYLLLRPGPRPAPGTVAAYELEAKKGDIHAMRTLGTWYTYGLNVPRDPVKGKAWYRKAAEAGDTVAEQELAAVENQEKK
ncbi:MAG TPA: hypothetical protein VJ600_07295 [Holophagaceae bacterium]|nr:hypothetical protein [Holophagaceae bacterium]